jgi:two-component sensor histidine kinase
VPSGSTLMSRLRSFFSGGGFSRLTTAAKMLLILGLALFPLGLVALLASVDAARDGRAERETQARAVATESAATLNRLLGNDLLALKLALEAGDLSGDRRMACSLLARVGSMDTSLRLDRFAVFGPDGRAACVRGETATAASALRPIDGSARLILDPSQRALRFGIGPGDSFAIGAVNLSSMRAATRGSGDASGVDLRLQQGDRQLQVLEGRDRSFLQRTVTRRARLQNSDVLAVASVGAIPISAAEIASILLPLVMWLAAAMFGWLIVDRLLLRPIVRMQKAVLAYSPGGPAISIPHPMTPATEIRDLGDAFARVTGTVAAHEAELEAAIARQARLVREVHHRVKNNLQVVASLLNLHARGARSVEASNAYATIQRRVDALSVVHRNHFAELEGNRGVALRPLLSELTGNLRATAPDEAAGMAITLDLDAVYVNQDVAVSVSFFVTEVVEHAMLCAPNEVVEVALRSLTPTSARLTLGSRSLRADAEECEAVDARQFERITTGLSRQLRAALERDTVLGRFGIDISTLADEMPT